MPMLRALAQGTAKRRLRREVDQLALVLDG